MKVCAVTTWPPHKDGVALYSAELFTRIANLVNLDVISNISEKNSKSGSNKIVSSSWKPRPWYPITVFRSVFKTRCNIVHIQHGWLLYGGLLSSLLFPVLLLFFCLSRKACVVTMHSVIRKNAKLYRNFLVNLLVRMAILWISKCIAFFSCKVVVHNRLMKLTLQTDFNIQPEKITVIPHGVKKSVAPSKVSKNHEQLTVLSLGFIRKEKNIECLIDAFKIFLEDYPDSKLVIVGGKHAHDNTSYSKTFKARVPPKLQNHVFFAGFVDDDLLQQFITKSDVVVLQSSESNYIEASGTVATVADYGKPIICSNVPKFRSDLHHETDCIMVSPSSSAELAQVLVLLKKNKKLRQRLGENLRNKHKSNYWDAVANQHVSLYNHILTYQKTERSVL